MALLSSQLFLYNFTLQKSGAIHQCICGNFSEAKAQEIIVSRGKTLELLRPSETTGSLDTIISTEVFGIIRSLIPFRLAGTTKDFIIIGSDSGKIVILEVKEDRFEKVHEEVFGRSGARRIVPGQYLAADPKGRAVLIGAVEKQKFVYTLNRDSNAKLTISSPLEAHKSHTILFDVVGLDVEFNSPLFACIEVSYDEMDRDPTGEAIANAQKVLTFYELDLGLNHVVRKNSFPIDRSAHKLIAVPGGAEGPGGVLICAQDTLYYKSLDLTNKHIDILAKLPRRKDTSFTGVKGEQDAGTMIVAAASHKLKGKPFFFLVQTESGDIFKIELPSTDNKVDSIKVAYFDTTPPATSLCLLKTGFLFVASECSDQYFYQFKSLDGNEIEGDTFSPLPLRNLELLDKIKSLNSICDIRVEDLQKEDLSPQLYCLCGQGARSSLRVLKHGLPMNELAQQAGQGQPTGVWSVKFSSEERYDRYIVASYVNSTIVLALSQNGVEQVKESKLNVSVPTLLVSRCGEDSMIQIHAGGIWRIKQDGSVIKWEAPDGRKITHASANESQVVIALGEDIIYFELDSTNNLIQYEEFHNEKEITAVAIQPVPSGKIKSKFVALADVESKIRVFMMNPAATNIFELKSMQLALGKPVSLQLCDMATSGQSTQLYAFVGTANGILQRVRISTTGEILDAKAKFMGKAVRLFPVTVAGNPAIFCASSKSWLCYSWAGTTKLAPLSYTPLECVSSFSAEPCETGGLVGLSKDALCIFTPENLADVFHQTEFPLRYTPRQSTVHPVTKHLIIIESQHNAYPRKEEEEEKTQLPLAMYGPPSRPGPGKWASCIRVFDPIAEKTIDLVELADNEAAFSITTCSFRDQSGDVFICVGTAQDLVIAPKKSLKAGFIHVYRMEKDKLEFISKKQVEDVPTALQAHQSRLLAGIGGSLKIFDLGKKKWQLLRKCEAQLGCNQIVKIQVNGDRIFVADIQDSVMLVKYNRPDNSLTVICDDSTPKWATSITLLDYSTVAIADKFGNVSLIRVPEKVLQLENDPSGNRSQWETGYLNGAPHKFETIASIYVGETVTRVVKTKFSSSATTDIILYATLGGGLGVLLPFATREDVDFFSRLEMSLRQEAPPLCGRDHLAFRSYYHPVKSVVDGDLIEQFLGLVAEKQEKIALALDADGDIPVATIEKKIDDIRDSIF